MRKYPFWIPYRKYGRIIMHGRFKIMLQLLNSYFYTDPHQLTLLDMLDSMGTACRKSDIEGGDGAKKTLSTDHDLFWR